MTKSVNCSFYQNFEVIALLSTDHGEEDAKFRAHIHIFSISEDKVFASFLLAGENYCDLLGRNRQNWEVNAIELIKTAPRTRLSQTWKLDTHNFTKPIMLVCICICGTHSSKTAKIVLLFLMLLRLQ